MRREREARETVTSYLSWGEVREVGGGREASGSSGFLEADGDVEGRRSFPQASAAAAMLV